MSKRYIGSIVSALKTGAVAPYSGVWPLNQQMQAVAAGNWTGVTGTIAIFALGYAGAPTYIGSTRTNKYTFSGDVNAVATSLTATTIFGSAAGPATLGIFTLGNYNSSSRNKYTYVGCVVSSATSASVVSYYGSAVGNSTVGIFQIGITSCNRISNLRNKYTYSGDTNSAGTASSVYSYAGAAAGNSSVGIFQYGLTSLCSVVCNAIRTTTRGKYTYSGDVSASATASSANSQYGAATGNSTLGIFQLGDCAAIRNKYTYSGDVNAVATAVSGATRSFAGAAAGNTTIGIFSLGDTGAGCGSTTRNKYTYAACTSGSATAASGTGYGQAAASNGICGVNV
jgi:hypothetical protein